MWDTPFPRAPRAVFTFHHIPLTPCQGRFLALKRDDQSPQEGKYQSRTSYFSVTSQITRTTSGPAMGQIPPHVPHGIKFCSCAKLSLGTQTAAQQSPVLLALRSRALMPPQLPLPRARRAGEVATEEQQLLPSSKNLSQSFKDQESSKQEQPPICPV